jgi:hypothetical protein
MKKRRIKRIILIKIITKNNKNTNKDIKNNKDVN